MTVSASPVNLLPDEDAEELRTAVRSMLADLVPWQDVLARAEGFNYAEAAWRSLVKDLGGTVLAVPESLGGQGASWREAAVVAEEVGRVVGDMPFVAATLGTAALLAAGAEVALADLAASGSTAVLAHPWHAPPGPGPEAMALAGDRLTGSVPIVSGAARSDQLLTFTAAGELVVFDAADAAVEEQICLDMTNPLATVRCEQVPARVVAEGHDAKRAVATLTEIGDTLVASELLGIAEHAFADALAYAGQRRQFGRLIGSYQAVKHRLADAWTDLIQARAMVKYAVECVVAGTEDRRIAACTAFLVASRTAIAITEDAIQVYGGIGFTWEHPVHLYLKRARANSAAAGGVAGHRARLAVLADLTLNPENR